jgi:hypothetical protein
MSSSWKKLLSTAAILLAYVSVLNATSIGITLGPTRTTSSFTSRFSALNGVSLNGQSLSLDFVFTDNFVRFLPPGSAVPTGLDFDILVALDTNANGVPGFASGNGFIFDQNGQPLQMPADLGSAASDAGKIFVSLFPLLNGAARNASFFGFHMNLTLPDNPAFEITGADLKFFPGHVEHPFGEGQFGIGPHVADSGSGAVLFASALLMLGAASKSLSLRGR